MVAGRREAAKAEVGEYQRVTALLGGPAVLKSQVLTRLDAHRAIKQGLPGGVLQSFLTNLHVLKRADIEKAVGMSIRTFQRRKGDPDKPLSPEQSGRTWKLAEILAQATEVFGSQEEAEQWLERPATGLDNHCPIDLLDTPAGVEMVEEFLGRIAYGVYA